MLGALFRLSSPVLRRFPAGSVPVCWPPHLDPGPNHGSLRHSQGLVGTGGSQAEVAHLAAVHISPWVCRVFACCHTQDVAGAQAHWLQPRGDARVVGAPPRGVASARVHAAIHGYGEAVDLWAVRGHHGAQAALVPEDAQGKQEVAPQARLEAIAPRGIEMRLGGIDGCQLLAAVWRFIAPGRA